MSVTGMTVPSSVLAFVTTVHIALLLLRHHRSVRSLPSSTLLVPSIGLSAQPWFLTSPQWLVIGLLTHGVWFAACEKLLPQRKAPTARPAQSRPRSAAPSSPTTAAAPVSGTVSRPAAGFVQVPVLAVFDETEDIRTFRLARPAGLIFAPGQFLTVRIQVDGKPLVRCYSISSAPEATGYLEISIKRVGLVSGTIHSTVRPGSLLAVKGPAGAFVYPEGDDRPLVLLAGGVGITPVMSMLRHAVVSAPTRPVTLLFAVRDERRIVYRRELEWLAERHPQLRFEPVVSQGPHALGRVHGRINEPLLRRIVPDPVNAIYAICGPTPMMDAMRSILKDMGVPGGQVRYEAFEAAAALAREPAPGAFSSPASLAPALTLTFQGAGVSAQASPRQTLLEAAEAAGVDIPNSCRAGVCLTCRSRVLSGDVECSSDSLDEADRANGYVLPCVAWPKSDCVLEL